MGHELTPKSSAYLDTDEVISRLRQTFAIVETSVEMARENIDGQLKYGEGLVANGVTEATGVVARLRKVRDTSVMIGLAEKKRSGKARLTFLLKPGEPIFIDYENGRHEKAAKALVERAATALNYRVTVV